MQRRYLYILILVFMLSVAALGQNPNEHPNNTTTPLLSVTEMKRQVISCKPAQISRGLLPKGTIVTIRITVNETGDIVGLTPIERCPVGCGLLARPIVSLNKCKFALYSVDGHPTTYSGDWNLIAP